MWRGRLTNYSITEFLLVMIIVLFMIGLFNKFLVLNFKPDSYSDLHITPGSRLEKDFGTRNELDGCYHVYLDVGSNVGVQVRKLFEPKTYPDAPVNSVFDSYFGVIESDGKRGGKKVCAIGFEPNPHHTKTLRDIEWSHAKCGWTSLFYTETAAAHDYGTIDFLTDNDMNNKEWGGSIVGEERNQKGTKIGTAKKMRLSDYIFDRVLTRKIPTSDDINPTKFPTVLMKMDIEGSELEVLTDMLVSGALQHINYTFAEFHPGSFDAKEHRSVRLRELSKITAWFTEVTQTMGLHAKIKLDSFDDETFYTSSFPLPGCKN